MEFHDKLIFLMNITQTSNKELAHPLSVDPSLISLFRSGKRNPPRNADPPLLFSCHAGDAASRTGHCLSRIPSAQSRVRRLLRNSQRNQPHDDSETDKGPVITTGPYKSRILKRNESFTDCIFLAALCICCLMLSQMNRAGASSCSKTSADKKIHHCPVRPFSSK